VVRLVGCARAVDFFVALRAFAFLVLFWVAIT